MVDSSICCIGHITRDRIINPMGAVDMPGGTAYYFAKALENLNHDNFSLVTSVGEDNIPVTDSLASEGINIRVIKSRNSVFFENSYKEDMNVRTQRVLAKADPFSIENLAGISAGVFHLGTLLADDFDISVLKYLSQRGTLSVDIQGYLRNVVGEKVVPVDYPLKKEAMKYISILKANEHEMETLTGHSDPRKAAETLARWGCPEVVLTFGDKGSLIYAGGNFFEIPAFKIDNPVDATGCGDTYMAGYLYARSHGEDYLNAGRFASAMCALKLKQNGPFSGSLSEINNLLANG